MHRDDLQAILTDVKSMRAAQPVGRVTAIHPDGIKVAGLAVEARLGDQVSISAPDRPGLRGEIVAMEDDVLKILPQRPIDGIALGDRAVLEAPLRLHPDETWIGRVIDPDGRPLDGRPLHRGPAGLPLVRDAPPAVERQALGNRLETGLVVCNTLLPLVQGQRVGIFAGSGVGKTTLIGQLAQKMETDVVVIALVGERGREIRNFIDDILGKEGMKRCIIVAATSDQSALLRRRCAFAAMTVAEYFRDLGRSVLYFADSITRLADAHREVAIAAGEPPALRGHPASMTPLITSLCERAGPGPRGSGYITAVMSVLVAGSDMDEPVADVLRGVLDGHIVLDRAIAEAGRFPAIDIVRSVSRALPDAASDAENAMIASARKLLAAYDRSETMIRAGLYSQGSDPLLDRAIAVQKDLENLFCRQETQSTANSFRALKSILSAAETVRPAARGG